MKKGLENIEEVFKQTFEGFEANVDPSVWNNIQNSIASGTGAGSSIEPSSTTTSVVGKSFVLKLVAGVLAISSIATGVYFITDNPKADEDKIVNSYVVSDDSQQENKVLSVEEKELKCIESFDVIESKLNEEVLEVAVSLKQGNVNTAQEALSSGNEVIVPSSQDKPESKNEYLEEVNVPEVNKEEAADPTMGEVKSDVSTEEMVALKGTILASRTKGEAPLDVSFDVEGENILSYSWDFGDDSEIDKEESVFHTFQEPGEYKVELIILDKNANSKILIKYIEVESGIKPSLGFVPNAFSPNGDGLNDIYEFTTTRNIKSFNAKVLDPNTGSVVFEWNSIDGGWDGNDSSGKKLAVGSYYLSVVAIGIDGTVVQKNLRISLLDE